MNLNWTFYQQNWFVLLLTLLAGVALSVAGYSIRNLVQSRQDIGYDADEDPPDIDDEAEVNRILDGWATQPITTVVVTQTDWDDWEHGMSYGATTYQSLQELNPVSPAPAQWDPTGTGIAYANYAPQGEYTPRHSVDYNLKPGVRTLSPRWRELVSA